MTLCQMGSMAEEDKVASVDFEHLAKRHGAEAGNLNKTNLAKDNNCHLAEEEISITTFQESVFAGLFPA